MGIPFFPHLANTGYFHIWMNEEFELHLKSPSWLFQHGFSQTIIAQEQLVFPSRLNVPSTVGTWVFLQSVPYLASVPVRHCHCREPAFLSDHKKSRFEANWSFHNWPFFTLPQLGPSSKQGHWCPSSTKIVLLRSFPSLEKKLYSPRIASVVSTGTSLETA